MILGLLYLALFVVPTFLPPADSLANPNNLPTTCSVELTGFRGLQAASAPGATSPAFDLVVRVDNGHDFPVSHGGGDVVVSYAGVPLARGRTPSFDVHAKEAVALPVNATSEGVGVPEDLLRLLMEERRWGVAQLEIELKVAWESFACDVDLDGQARSSACYKPTTIY
ncbi:hypothetical protein HU200_046294 [Digitaria exilis]|uniref:Late embryogenesis abundant protein LEA-2 subgroup domain-containing protein n=1 Tax=Digitaria exilis TaxID=1010633 RepID=A0A835E9I3_9POAL|nr:hypothetical protein HU200_046294 [Digitaria exilis]